MSKKRKERENDNLAQFPSDTPQTFRELSQLTNVELNNFLRTLGLPVKQKRNHKLTTLASHLQISTIDGKDQDPFLQTLADVKSLKDGWTTDLRQVPIIRNEYVLSYLLAAHDITVPTSDSESYTSASLETYRATRAYDLWESGHISGFQFNNLVNINGYCAVKCLANPSGDTSGTQYTVIVILKECGKPIGASCTCVAGLGEACTHIAGLMFGLEEFISRGYKGLPDSASTTEKLCKWIVPRGPKVVPKKLVNVSVKKNIPGKKNEERNFRISNFQPLPKTKQNINYDKLTQLHHTLGIVKPNIPWVTAVAPAVLAENRPPSVIHSRTIIGPSELPATITDNTPILIPAHCCEVKTCQIPPCVSEKITARLDNNIKFNRNEVVYSPEEIENIETVSKKQHKSVLWFKYRKGLITASKFHQVYSHMKVLEKKGITSATENLVESLVTGSTFKGNKATRYGQQQEPKAVKVYRELQ